MKILELRFKNLNSLYGEWLIDFTHPEYISNGIFALTGPTGSGKSTILDAICLALYGATPRLGKITKSGNEIMSRQSGECYAEVVFESQAGRFRCHWEQRRARKSIDGKLQDQEHQIMDAYTGTPLEVKKSLVSSIIEEKTGMDFDRFTRSILLAQGGFDTFLKADAEQKSRILEQITGTTIYSEISCKVHERKSEELETLKLLQAETNAISLLTADQEEAFSLELDTKTKEEISLSARYETTKEAIVYLEDLAARESEIAELTEKERPLLLEKEAFASERNELEQAIKAASLDSVYATLKTNRNQFKEMQKSLADEQSALPALETSAQEQAIALRSAEQLTIDVKNEKAVLDPLITRVRSLDQTISDQQKQRLEIKASCKKDQTAIDANEQEKNRQLKILDEAKESLNKTQEYLKNHAEDETLIHSLGSLKIHLENLISRQNEITEKKTKRDAAEKNLQNAEKALDDSRSKSTLDAQQLTQASQGLQKEKDALHELLGERLLREYRAEKDSLQKELIFLHKIASLTEHRAKLEDDQPCPLCGALTHPFAEGNVPIPDETEQKIKDLVTFITTAEEKESLIQTLSGTASLARATLVDSEKEEATATSEVKAAKKTVSELEEALASLSSAFENQKQTVIESLSPLGIHEIPKDNVSELLASLTSRLEPWNNQVNSKQTIEKQLTDIASEIKRIEAIITTQTNVLNEKHEQLKTLESTWNDTCAKRKKLFQDKLPDEEASHMDQVLSDAEKAEKSARDHNTELKQAVVSSRNHIASLQTDLDGKNEELLQLEADFSSALLSVGFSDETTFKEAILTEKERKRLSDKAKRMDDDLSNLQFLKEDRKAQLIREQSKHKTESPLEELKLQKEEYEHSLSPLRERIASLKFSLQENTSAKEKIKEKLAEIEVQRKECLRWEKLHSLIGSADGKKYRNFAQGLTFELMVAQANRQLEKMTDRYLLMRNDEQPLELNVIDSYQAGEIRSTKNLSGGESFIVSLALALGLSKMASKKVRVDSLFLDEGFGTLDDDALETALETLSGLQQDGKLIGIISHVSALKERISTQIQVMPLTGGRSRIVGPGCRKIH